MGTRQIKKLTKLDYKKYYSALTEEERLEIRETFVQKTGLSVPTFYLKMRTGNFRPMEQKLIKRLLHLD